MCPRTSHDATGRSSFQLLGRSVSLRMPRLALSATYSTVNCVKPPVAHSVLKNELKCSPLASALLCHPKLRSHVLDPRRPRLATPDFVLVEDHSSDVKDLVSTQRVAQRDGLPQPLLHFVHQPLQLFGRELWHFTRRTLGACRHQQNAERWPARYRSHDRNLPAELPASPRSTHTSPVSLSTRQLQGVLTSDENSGKPRPNEHTKSMLLTFQTFR